jgi:hypothetical protein
MYALLLTLTQLGCSPSGSVVVEGGTPADTNAPAETEDPNDTEDLADSEDSADTDDTADTEAEALEAYAGVFEGDLAVILISEWFDYELEDCTATADISDEGEIDGEGSCGYGDGGGWGANAWNGGGDESEEIPLSFTGEVNADGEITGTIEVELDWDDISIDPMPMEGETDGEDVSFEFEGEMVTDWLSADVVGDGELWR